MASAPTTKQAADENDGDINDKSDGSKSYFQKAVCLTDWWLVKAENDFGEKGLAVGGFTLRHNVRQEFSSAPIEKVYDVFTLETMDGICILLQGLINKTRTVENGFPSKVFNHFVFGFPPHWESFAAKDSWEESPPKAVSEIVFGLQKSSSCSQSVPEFRKTTRKDNKDDSSAETNGPKCIKNSKMKIGSKRGNQSEETENKACVQKNMNKADSISQRLRSCYNKQNQTLEGGMTIDCRIPCTPGSKAKRKLAYEGHVLENGKGEASALSAEPSTSNGLRSGGLESRDLTQTYYEETIDKSLRGNLEEEISERDNQKDGGVGKVVVQKNMSKGAQSSLDLGFARSEKKKTCDSQKIDSVNVSAPLGKNGQNGVSAFISPQSLSCKRSRSGRLLMPPLEFWRNQRAIYDVDRRVTGVVEDLDLTI